jgi:hypothetical protein
MRLDDPLGPEFSVRIMSRCAAHNITTVDELRAALPQLHKWKGLGKKSIFEIRSYFHYLESPQTSMLPELDDQLFHDMIMVVHGHVRQAQDTLFEVALAGKDTPQMRRNITLHLHKALRALEGAKAKT